MRLTGPTLPTIAVSASIAALISGLVVSAVDGRHHSTVQKVREQTISTAQQQSIAHQLTAMTLPAGVAHSTICPRAASPADACFTAALPSPATSALVAATASEKLLTSLGVSLGLARSCSTVPGGPSGSGYQCIADGTWHGSRVATTVFVSDQSQRPAGIAGLDAMVSVSDSKA